VEDDVSTLITRLLAHQVVRRDDRLSVRALTDESFRQDLETRLAACGLEFLDNPYAEYVSVGLIRNREGSVFQTEDAWVSNNAGMDRSAVALLVVLWALLILPKRQRQIERTRVADVQGEMFATSKPLPRGEAVSASIAERTLISDFGEKLGKTTRVRVNLGILARLGFIVRRSEQIYEGPLLDLALDYGRMAPRLLDGALTDLLAQRPAPTDTEPASDV
jgi:hypothetical protein